MLTQEGLKKLILYDPETGVFRWRVRRSNRVNAGDIAGTVMKNGCGNQYVSISITIDGTKKIRLAHRLAVLYMTGSEPKDQVDHIDGNGLNNRWENLRTVSHRENGCNQKLRSTSSSGLMGVSLDKSIGKLAAYIWDNGRKVHLGYSNDFFEAACMRKSAEVRYGYHDNHGRKPNGS